MSKQAFMHAMLMPVLACLPLAACGQGSDKTPAPFFDAVPFFDAAQAAHPNYVTPPGYKTECTGRHLVDLPEMAEWATTQNITLGYNLYTGFSPILVPQENHGLVYAPGSVSVSVGLPVTFLNERRQSARWRIHKNNEDVNKTIDIRREIIEDALKDNRLENARETEASIEEEKEKLQAHREIDLGIPDSYFDVDYDTIIDGTRWIDGRTYSFGVKIKEGESFESAVARLKDLASRFRPRRPYEIPTEPGVCLPYGFIADDGKTAYDFQISFRFKSAPGVIHTLRTGKNGADTFAMEAKLFSALLPFLDGPVGKAAAQQKLRRTELTKIFVGPYETSYAGFRVYPKFNGKISKDENYRIVSGISGLPQSDVVPFVYYEMNGYAQGMDPSLKTPAPPLEQSLKPMRAILKSVRLRTPDNARAAMARQTPEPFPVFTPTFKTIDREIVLDCAKTTSKWRSPRATEWHTPLNSIHVGFSVFAGDPWHIVRSDTPPERMRLVPKEDIVLSGTYAANDGNAIILSPAVILSPEQQRSLIQARCSGKDNFWLVTPVNIYRMPMAR